MTKRKKTKQEPGRIDNKNPDSQLIIVELTMKKQQRHHGDTLNLLLQGEE